MRQMCAAIVTRRRGTLHACCSLNGEGLLTHPYRPGPHVRGRQLAPATWYAESTYSSRAYYNLANCVARHISIRSYNSRSAIKSVKSLPEELYWKNYIRRSFPPPICRRRIVIRKGRGGGGGRKKIRIYRISARRGIFPRKI